MAANLKFFCAHLNQPHLTRLGVKILLNYQLKKNGVSQASFNNDKRIYNSQPFMKGFYSELNDWVKLIEINYIDHIKKLEGYL